MTAIIQLRRAAIIVAALIVMVAAGAVSAVTTDDVVNAGVTVSAVRRGEEGAPLQGGLKDQAAVLDEAIRGFAREAPSDLLPRIVEHHRGELAALLPGSSYFGTSSSATQEEHESAATATTTTAAHSSMFGPITASPEQIHLGFGDEVVGTTTTTNGAKLVNVSIMWITSTAVTTGRACVACGGGSSSPSFCVAADSYTYTPISLLPWRGTIHRAFVGLPSTKKGMACSYTVGPSPAESTDGSLWSGNISFIVPAMAISRGGNSNNNIINEVFVALGGDMGTIQLVGYKVAAAMHSYDANVKAFDAFWHLGDIAYSTLDPPKLNFEFFWDMYLRQEQSLLDHVPILATYGNHDFAGGDSGAFVHRFYNPREPYGGNGNFYFAARQGPVLYVSMCTEWSLNPAECSYDKGSKQYEWLEATFSAVNRSETPWVVLAGHRPMYSSDESTDSGPLRAIIEPLLIQYGVDVQFAGHMHCTELTTPVNNFVPALSGVSKNTTGGTENSWIFDRPTAPVHMTVGTLGAVITEKFQDPSPAWSLFHAGTLFSDSYGFATLTATPDRLEVRFVKQSDGSTMWDVVITK